MQLSAISCICGKLMVVLYLFTMYNNTIFVKYGLILLFLNTLCGKIKV